jgi:hypothetical protein
VSDDVTPFQGTSGGSSGSHPESGVEAKLEALHLRDREIGRDAELRAARALAGRPASTGKPGARRHFRPRALRAARIHFLELRSQQR